MSGDLDLAKELRSTTEAMASQSGPSMTLWDRHSNACLGAADTIERLTKERDEARAALQWRDMGSAPDEIEFRCILGHAHSVITGYWDGHGWVNERNPGTYFSPDRWMPLPAAPGPANGPADLRARRGEQ